MPLSFTLAVHQPTWVWVVSLASLVSTNVGQTFYLIFPNGRFVPRWTRWAVIVGFVGSIFIWFYRPFVEHPHQIEFVAVFVLIFSIIGLYALVYRYIRVASPPERQQLKWIIVGSSGFLLTTLLVLQPLNELLTSRAGSMDPAQVLVLSAILDTLFHAATFLLPVSIVIAVLRYRLWDIDVIISRACVRCADDKHHRSVHSAGGRVESTLADGW